MHVHLHDNDGHRDLHLPIGTGRIDWDRFIPRLKGVYDGTVTMEVFSNDRAFVTLAKHRFLQRWYGNFNGVPGEQATERR